MKNNLFLQLQLIFLFCSLSYCKEVTVNIFIHGTVKPYLKVRNISTIVRQDKNIACSSYATFNNYMRASEVITKYQAMQKLGLKKIDLNDIKPGNGSTATAILYDYFDNKENSLFYTFGWSGLLSYEMREKEGIFLYNKIKNLVKKLKNENLKPKINIITYSHGGTVALNMAKVYKKDFKINNLILLGMPVQRDTDYLINCPVFKNIYHFYSTSDYVQTIDHASSKYFECHRKFYPRKDFCLPAKLKQIEIGVVRTSICTSCNAFKCSNTPIKKTSYHVNPAHSELWVFGWTFSGYRRNYPIYPFPIVVFIPAVINEIKKLNTSSYLFADIDPRLGEINIKDLANKKCYSEKFIDFCTYEKLKQDILDAFHPDIDLNNLKNKTKDAAKLYTFYKHDPCKCVKCRRDY